MIGQTIWVFDQNRRIYRKPEPGRIYSSEGPIWREHWVPRKIIGETRVSWLTNYNEKIPKKGRHGVAFTQEEIDRQEFVAVHRYKIADRIQRCQDYKQLSAIAEILGYKP